MKEKAKEGTRIRSGVLKPRKESVGKRIRFIKDELGVSLTDLGNRLGLKKSTINSYVQGYTLAPSHVIEQLSLITGRSIGWFYFGTTEEYIWEYLLKRGCKELLLDHPDIPIILNYGLVTLRACGLKLAFLKTAFGYPHELVIDVVFLFMYKGMIKEHRYQTSYFTDASINENGASRIKKIIKLKLAN